MVREFLYHCVRGHEISMFPVLSAFVGIQGNNLVFLFRFVWRFFSLSIRFLWSLSQARAFHLPMKDSTGQNIFSTLAPYFVLFIFSPVARHTHENEEKLSKNREIKSKTKEEERRDERKKKRFGRN